jgi:hypothetical protein
MTERPKSEKETQELKPIMTCVGTLEDFGGELKGKLKALRTGASFAAENVDFWESKEKLEKRGQKNAGNNTYVISTISNRDKFSRNFYNCTGLVVVGVDKKTGKEISFISHQEPGVILNMGGVGYLFKADLSDSLIEMRDRCVSGSVDISIVGGQFIDTNEYRGYRGKDIYEGIIELLTEEVLEVFKFSPHVAVGPKIIAGRDDVYFDTKERRLYVIRPHGISPEENQSFMPEDLPKVEETLNRLN